MQYHPKSDLEKLFFDEIQKGTPDYIIGNPLLDLANKESFTFTLKREHLLRNSNDPRPLDPGEARSEIGLGLNDWFANYKREAMYSTAGIRGPQNPLYPWDTRYPISFIGVMLATLGKSLVARETIEHETIHKLAASEVRYNSKSYVEIIARIQASMDITTHITSNFTTIPIWMASFLIFMLDLYGGEYVTSSHSISKKTATKDLNFQGSQYIPEESSRFVTKIEEILKEVEDKGSYIINFSAPDDHHIDQQLMNSINSGVPLYLEYLRNGIATDHNLRLITNNPQQLIIDCMGGSMFHTMETILAGLDIVTKYDFIRTEEDPFFYGIGKVQQEDGSYFDYSGDSTMVSYNHQDHTYTLPVLETMMFEQKLQDYPLSTAVLMTDPDGDRLVTAQIEPISRVPLLDELGILYLKLGKDRVLTLYLPNQLFLLTFDFQMQSLKNAGLWDQFDWFMIKTTPSSLSWDQWASANNVPVINTPVGFKEIATIMQKIETHIKQADGSDIFIEDVFGKNINLGRYPRLLFAGEESGGEIFGPAELIESKNGREAIAMREKSAGEAIIITSALIAKATIDGNYLSDYLHTVYESHNISAQFDVRIDVKYYNENESDIVKLNRDKEAGMSLRTQNDLFFLTLALGIKDHVFNINDARAVLTDAFSNLDFSDLKNIYFVGDGTYLEFPDKFVEVRPSGTDAINKAYSTAESKEIAITYAQALGNYSGDRTQMHRKLVTDDFYNKAKEYSLKKLKEYQAKDLPLHTYSPPKKPFFSHE